MDEFYKKLGKDKAAPEFERRRDLKEVYTAFFSDFKNYLVEFVRDQALDLYISSMEVDTKPRIISDDGGGARYLTIKNQGEIECYVTTDKTSGYRIDSGEKVKFWLNKQVTILTISGSTTVGYVRS